MKDALGWFVVLQIVKIADCEPLQPQVRFPNLCSGAQPHLFNAHRLLSVARLGGGCDNENIWNKFGKRWDIISPLKLFLPE